jgi:hypothetical protein
VACPFSAQFWPGAWELRLYRISGCVLSLSIRGVHKVLILRCPHRLQAAEKTGKLGDLNPYPSVVFCGQSGVWLIFGLGKRNRYVTAAVGGIPNIRSAPIHDA